MSRTPQAIKRQIRSAEGLLSVVRTMKSLAAVSIGPYETSLSALEDYVRTVETGFGILLRKHGADLVSRLSGKGIRRKGLSSTASEAEKASPAPGETDSKRGKRLGVVVFGADHGMVADFNDRLARFTRDRLLALGADCRLWVVGEQVWSRLEGCGFALGEAWEVPESVESIPSLLCALLRDIEDTRLRLSFSGILVFFNRPFPGSGFEPVAEHLLPMDVVMLDKLASQKWPGRRRPESILGSEATLEALIREYLFVALFKACARSGAAEHSTRLAAMQRAERNIGERLEGLGREYHEQRQTAISAELSDVLAGFELLR